MKQQLEREREKTEEGGRRARDPIVAIDHVTPRCHGSLGEWTVSTKVASPYPPPPSSLLSVYPRLNFPHISASSCTSPVASSPVIALLSCCALSRHTHARYTIGEQQLSVGDVT